MTGPDEPRWPHDSEQEDFEVRRALAMDALRREYEEPIAHDPDGNPVKKHKGHHVKRYPTDWPPITLHPGEYCDACLHEVPMRRGQRRTDKLHNVAGYRVCGVCAGNAPALVANQCARPIEIRRWSVAIAHKVDPVTELPEHRCRLEWHTATFDKDTHAFAGYEVTATDWYVRPTIRMYWAQKREKPGSMGG
jgi:hypothetical protein